MKSLTTILLSCLCAVNMMAQKPFYLPGNGVYIAGLPADMSKTYDGPVLVAEAYQTTFKTSGATLAAIKAGSKSYNISDRIKSDGTLDLISFMGCGKAENLIVRNYDGESYTIGDNAPEKTWSKVTIAAAVAPWDEHEMFTLGMYDHWDCPVTYAEDKVITEENMDGITVEFGNPHEGLVTECVNFNIVSDNASLLDVFNGLKVTIKVWDDSHSNVEGSLTVPVTKSNLRKIKTTDNGETIYSVYAFFDERIILNTTFSIDVDGLSNAGAKVWLPRAVDTHNLYPTHTTYRLNGNSKTVAESDVCLNIDGYFNYLGTWAWYDGKEEYGEVVAAGDYVQVYYDPSDPDWPGEFFTGEVTFPVECAFGYTDIMLVECPDWISDVQLDNSQWEEYESVLIIMTADALPSGETGRYDKVVFSTKDGASFYTIHVRQGTGKFPSGIDAPVVDIPAEGGFFDITGRRIENIRPGQIFIHNGKKYISK